MIIYRNKNNVLTFHSIQHNKDESGILVSRAYEKETKLVAFDDGLWSQMYTIKELAKDPNKTVWFFPSGFLIRSSTGKYSKKNLITNSLAHKQLEILQEHEPQKYFNKESDLFGCFMTQEEIEELIMLNVNFGIHGWYHLNLNLSEIKGIERRFNKRILSVLREDASLSWDFYRNLINLYPQKFINKDTLKLWYCTPYNVYNPYQELWIELFKASIQKNPISSKCKIEICIFSHERNSKE